jgi:transcriptional regulator with XRE-family HTH domain
MDVTTEDWERRVGDQVRALRIAALLGQDDLAERANISVTTVQALERGSGSSLKTLIRVLRVLGRTDWLDGLDPRGDGPSPLELLRQSRRQSPRPQRVPRGRA